MVFLNCNGGMNSKAKAASTIQDTARVDSIPLMPIADTLDGSITKRLRTKISIEADSLNPISRDSLLKLTKAEQRRVRDSARLALDEKPKHVYFTFDDGPLLGSAAIDSIATAKKIKINAFLVGRHANMSKGLKRDFERYYNNPLVDCYNHSYTHANNKFSAFYSNPVGAYDDFVKNEEDLTLKHKIARLPGRNIWVYEDVRKLDLQSGASTADMLFTNGYKVYGWDVEWKIHGLTGKPLQSVNDIYKSIRRFMDNKNSMEPNNVVLLMHDDMFQNKKGQQLLSALIDSIQVNTDYKFEFMRSYPFRY
ncbi:polysaccharide deacetylase family protein [Sphingobacterium sp. UT-1RO-CII-1]|uniref:polysaccharide deacetylase family protein n=1 Tax=Sphingobacterium sp. UT-1RO-CII-1 TaxID=2995225 RepID=UPI00227BA001|nr:polysaccharide deacetylase family protein [Sphingobacterium sp. UT-1RO-CII-1]MCY4779213.1 polysaccharide deacetylase family protein [Sphingobacterium sp. UT-1RO-CII-1]